MEATSPIDTMKSREVLVLGLNPAFQATLHFEKVKFGKVNRAFRKCNSIGGKGQNFAIACSQYGDGDKLSVVQIVGGMTGRYIQAFLDEQKIHHISICVRKATRTCTTLLDKFTGDMTELIEPAARVDAKDREILEQTIKKLVTGSPQMEAIALCGTLPPGITGHIYTLVAQMKPPSIVLLLDAYQNAECLSTGKVDILKINAEEARVMACMEEDADILEVGKRLHEQYTVKMIAITNGPGESFMFESVIQSQKKSLKITKYSIPDILDMLSDMNDIESHGSSPLSASLPEATGEPSTNPFAFYVKQDQRGSNTNLHASASNMAVLNNHRSKEIVLNPLGAGDTCSAIFLLEYLDTRDASLSFQHGLAAASASCLVIDSTSQFDIRIKRCIFERIQSENFIRDM